jgi:SAM-dependent methyltransferase
MARARGDLRIYLDEMEACHGSRAKEEAGAALVRHQTPKHVLSPLNFPLNRRIANEAEGIIVHSAWSQNRFQQIAPQTPITKVNHHITTDSARKLDFDPRSHSTDCLQVASFGLITPDKGIGRALRALSRLRADHRFHYSLVGVTNNYFDVRELIRKHEMTDLVSVHAGVSIEEFNQRIHSTDIAINLRERTVGETSGSLCRIMAAAVPAIVSNVGWFGELPDDAVVKVDNDIAADEMLFAFLKTLIENQALRQRMGCNAREYVLREHDIKRSAAGYLDFISDVVSNRTRRGLVRNVSIQTVELGIADAGEKFFGGLAREVETIVPNACFASAVGGNGKGLQLPNSNRIHIDDARENPLPLVKPNGHGTHSSLDSVRLPKIQGVDYKRAAKEYPNRLDAERRHYLFTKPFYNLANKPPKHTLDGMDVETHRHFSDFANLAVALGLPAGQRILDVGCGSGWLSEYLARLGYEVTGIDISNDLIEIAKARVNSIAYDVDHESKLVCRFIAHDIEKAPLAETFDAVICYDSLHHFEDERAVLAHLAHMTAYGGYLFIMEGDKPESGSATETELIGVMEEYQTLESPFSRDYLCELLEQSGFRVVGDYLSINGLFERDSIVDGMLPVAPAEVNYLLCKKVVEGISSARTVPDSSQPKILRARLTVVGDWPSRVEPGELIDAQLKIENIGDTLWLSGPASLSGSVMVGAKLVDHHGEVVSEKHGDPVIPRSLCPGESVQLRFSYRAPIVPGQFKLRLDLVAQHIAWFEYHGSDVLELELRVQ